jgi:predicted RNA binding protein YcfA (HicA-like mRNA interferase family)
MSKLRPLKYEKVVSLLKRLGFHFYRRGKGSHELWVRDSDGKVVPVPAHKGKTLKMGTLRAIIREVGVAVEEFLKLII